MLQSVWLQSQRWLGDCTAVTMYSQARFPTGVMSSFQIPNTGTSHNLCFIFINNWFILPFHAQPTEHFFIIYNSFRQFVLPEILSAAINILM